jgi:hypothetical protein
MLVICKPVSSLEVRLLEGVFFASSDQNLAGS